MIEDRPVPEGGGQAVIRTEVAGICGTDLHIFHGGIPIEYPRVMGHEMVGFVAQPGPEGLMGEGTRVLVNPAISCGTCRVCNRGLDQLCPDGGLMGRDGDGVFAELALVDERRLLEVPAGVSRAAGGLLQVLGTVIHAQRTARVFPDQTAVVVGLGVAGVLHLQTLLARGLTKVVGVELIEEKLAFARRFDATAVVAPDEAEAAVEEISDGRGADVVFECVGLPVTLAQSIEVAGLGAQLVMFGIQTGGAENLPFYQLYHKELTVLNPRAAVQDDYQTAIDLVAMGRLDVEPLATASFPLDSISEALEATGDPGNLKVLIEG
jgi:L-iditol 2-dehydrogenase